VAKDETKAQAPDVPKAQPKASVVEARRPEANKPPGEKLENARARASGVGLLAMKNELAELHAAPAAVQLNKDIKPGRAWVPASARVWEPASGPACRRAR